MKKVILNYLFRDVDFKKLYNKYNKSNKRYRKTLRDFLESISWRSYVLDKTYIDISYVILEGIIIDLDDLYLDYETFLKN